VTPSVTTTSEEQAGLVTRRSIPQHAPLAVEHCDEEACKGNGLLHHRSSEEVGSAAKGRRQCDRADHQIAHSGAQSDGRVADFDTATGNVANDDRASMRRETPGLNEIAGASCFAYRARVDPRSHKSHAHRAAVISQPTWREGRKIVVLDLEIQSRKHSAT
jgi:hypothetical protein